MTTTEPPMVARAPLDKHTRRNIKRCLDVLVNIHQLYGFKGEFKLDSTVEHWETLVADCGSWVKVAKYKLAAYFAWHTNQKELPPVPFQCSDHPHVLLGGRLGRFADLFLKRSSHPVRLSFLASIKQSKKGMPRPTEKMVQDSVRTTVEKLTNKTISPMTVTGLLPWSEVEDYPNKVGTFLSQMEFESQLERTVKELFHDNPLTTQERVEACFPSTSANYINSRSNAGAVGSILQHPTLLKGLRREGGYINYEAGKERRDEMIENEEEKVESQPPDFKDAYQTLWIRLLGEASREENVAVPVGLAEPLKVRVITKGPPFIQTVLESIRKHMHGTLRRHPAFKLLGQPADEKYILERLGNTKEEDEYYLSGDYEDATNNLKSWVSNAIAKSYSDEAKLYGVERRLLKDSLTGHTIQGMPQTQGQLMGSRTSFPILNIANATATRWAFELASKRVWTLKDLRAMFNGDDIAGKTTESGYKFWKQITEYIGLKSSVGKTYMSKTFVEINSTQYHTFTPHNFVDFKVNKERVKQRIEALPSYDGRLPAQMLARPRPSDREPVVRTNSFTETRYVNMGLMLGLKRSGARVGLSDQADPRNNLGVRYRKLIQSCPSIMREEVHNQFVHHHRKLLTAMKLPWYIPEWIGGVGMIGIKKPSNLDLRIAQMIIFNWKKTRPISLAHNEMNWKTWQKAENSVPEPQYVMQKGPGTEAYNKVVAAKCIDLLFDSNYELTDLYTDAMSKWKVGTAIAKNSKLWSPSKYKALPQPLLEEKLIYQTLYASYGIETSSSIAPSPPEVLD